LIGGSLHWLLVGTAVGLVPLGDAIKVPR